MMTFWFLRSAYVLIISALLLPSLATACSCPFVDPAGFVHASLKHFPANARGMLFMTPQGDPPPVVTEQDFVITSNKQAGPLRVALSYPALPLRRLRESAACHRQGFSLRSASCIAALPAGRDSLFRDALSKKI
jgi:hypothetical protein